MGINGRDSRLHRKKVQDKGLEAPCCERRVHWEGRRSRSGNHGNKYNLDKRALPTSGCTRTHNGLDTIISWTWTKTSAHGMHKNKTLTASLSKSRPSSPHTVVSTLLQRLARGRTLKKPHAVGQDVSAQ